MQKDLTSNRTHQRRAIAWTTLEISDPQPALSADVSLKSVTGSESGDKAYFEPEGGNRLAAMTVDDYCSPEVGMFDSLQEIAARAARLSCGEGAFH